MSFPADPLDLRTHLYYDGVWNAVPAADVRDESAHSGGGVSIRRGRADEASSVDPTECSLVLASPNGEYNPRVPTSALFGKIGRNTPLRVSVGEPHVGAADDSASASTSHVAPTVTAAKAGLLVCAWAGSMADYTAPGSMTEQAETDSSLATVSTATEAVSAGATGTRTATSSVSSAWTAVSAVLHGDSVSVEEVVSDDGGDVELTTAAGTQAGWWLVAVHHWSWDDGENSRDMPVVPHSNEGGWVVLAESDDTLFSTRRRRVRLLARRVERAGAQTESFLIPSDTAAIANHVHLLVLSGVDDWHIRATVEVPSWPQRWDKSGSDGWVPVQGAGVLRRLGGQGQERLRSPIHRMYSRDTRGPTLYPMAYWPMEDGEQANVLASVTPSQGAGALDNNVTLSSDDTIPGSLPLPVIGVDADVYAVRFPVSGHTPSNGWSVHWMMKMPDPGTMVNVPIAELSTTGDATVWQVQSFGGDVRVVAGDGVTALDSFTTTPTAFFDEWVHVHLSVSTSATVTIRWRRVGSDTVQNAAVGFGGSISDIGRVKRVTLGTGGAGAVTLSVGHLAVFNVSAAATTVLWDADNGWQGETAGNRLLRLSDEAGVPLVFVGDPAETAAMGVQRVGTLLQLLRECETVDLGVLYEPREMVGLAYRAKSSLYNQDALLALTYGAAGEVVPPLHPEPDDLLTANDVTVTRSGGAGAGVGSSARAVQTSGPLAVATIGTYPGSADVNGVSDLDLANQALWRVHLGTVDEDRFPVVSVNLAALGNAGKTALLTAAQVVDVGDRLTIDTPPDFLPPDNIDQLVQGYGEEFGQFEWRLELNCSPASPWRVLVWQAAGATPDPDAPARFDSGGSTVASSFVAGTGTSLSVAIATGHPLWTTDSADMPFDILVSGVRLRVTAISGASSPQTFTVTQAPVNGATKTIPAGDEVRLWASVPWAL